jgi:hypothetical protein
VIEEGKKSTSKGKDSLPFKIWKLRSTLSLTFTIWMLRSTISLTFKIWMLQSTLSLTFKIWMLRSTLSLTFKIWMLQSTLSLKLLQHIMLKFNYIYYIFICLTKYNNNWILLFSWVYTIMVADASGRGDLFYFLLGVYFHVRWRHW